MKFLPVAKARRRFFEGYEKEAAAVVVVEKNEEVARDIKEVK